MLADSNFDFNVGSKSRVRYLPRQFDPLFDPPLVKRTLSKKSTTFPGAATKWLSTFP